MRLIGEFENEKEAYSFYSLLINQGIRSSSETFMDPKTGEAHYRVWVLDEENFQRAKDLVSDYRAHLKVPEFTPSAYRLPQGESSPPKGPNSWKIKVDPKLRAAPFSLTLTNCIILICVLLYFWNSFEDARIERSKGVVAAEIGMTPVQEALLFDYPITLKLLDQFIATYPLKDIKDIKDLPPDAKEELKKIEAYPTWEGFYDMFLHWKQTGWKYFTEVPLFEKIREGQVWRLFTPCLIHGGFLHILFNMIWVWYLGRQIEERAGKWRMGLMIIIVGILSNVIQYLMSGPFFLGFSGVVVGMVGFIWMRQRIAPWEGYPLPRLTLLFIVFFVAALFVLDAVAFFLQLFASVKFSPNIANTAHIAGGLIGMMLGRIPLFSRGAA